MFRLICMATDGVYVTEGRDFETVEAAWKRADDMGSRWIFYPFCFVTTASGLTVKDSPTGMTRLNGMRVKALSALFERVSKMPKAKKISDVYEYVDLVMLNV